MLVKLKTAQLGGHVHAAIFIGPDGGQLALSGTLVMSPEEWELFRDGLVIGAGHLLMDDPVRFTIDTSEDGTG